ncbi:hypothetical protein GY45DRAFT_565315 [Cubamyces sp. BRFM 1775]|nr:hypothetical protein GY45DRAFT_565315 [Cubamyces sp. BRFM 1775]
MALQLDRISGKLVEIRAISQDWAQQWRFAPSGAGYTIETRLASQSHPPQAGAGSNSNSESDGHLYLTVDGHAQPGATVVATRFPVISRVECGGADADANALCVFWPDTNLVVSCPPRRSAEWADERDDRIILAECDNGPLSKWTDVVVQDSERESPWAI